MKCKLCDNESNSHVELRGLPEVLLEFVTPTNVKISLCIECSEELEDIYIIDYISNISLTQNNEKNE